MKVSLIVLSALLVILILLLYLPVRLEILYDSKETEEKVRLLIKYGFIKYRILPKKTSKKSKKAEEIEEKAGEKAFSYEKKKAELEKYIRIFNAIKKDVSKLLSFLAKRAVVFDKIAIRSEFGFDDAMNTGIFTGLYNGFVYSVMGVLHHTSNLRDMEIKLQPVFGKKCFNNHFSCILHIKTVHIIVIAFSVLKIFKKIKKEGRK